MRLDCIRRSPATPSCQRYPPKRVEMSNLARVGLTKESVASIFRQRIMLRTKRVGLRLTSFTGGASSKEITAGPRASFLRSLRGTKQGC